MTVDAGKGNDLHCPEIGCAGDEGMETDRVIKVLCAMVVVVLLSAGTAFPFCFDEAGGMYGINPQVLRAIASVESNMNPKALNRNANGTYDFGLMQINTVWYPTLGEKRWNRLGDACFNTKTGAWILATCIEKYGYNWKAIGCYNSQTPAKSEAYAKRVFHALKRLEKVPQPMDRDLEKAVNAAMDDLVERARRGEKMPAKTVFIPYVRVPKGALRTPPDLPAGSTVPELTAFRTGVPNGNLSP